MEYVYFTEEQKRRANSIDLIGFLQGQGEKLLPAGREKRLSSDHSITLKGNRWYDHASEEGGYATSLVMRLYNLSYPEAVSMLLGEQGETYQQYKEDQREQERKSFALPEANTDMRRAYAYLMKQRFIAADIIREFAKEKRIYEDKDYHNAVFVGMDEQGIPRHAHKKSTLSMGTSYRGNVEGSNPAYSFHYISENPVAQNLFVFEAPIDLLSFLTLHPKNWKNENYVALNGLSEKPIHKLLELYPHITHVILCLDQDAAGIEAEERITDHLQVNKAVKVDQIKSGFKDWNEELKAKNGYAAIPAEEHPQNIIKDKLRPQILYDISIFSGMDIDLAILKEEFERCRKQHPDSDAVKQSLKDMTAIALVAAEKEYAKTGQRKNTADLAKRLLENYKIYQNRGKLENKMSDISKELTSLFLLQKKECCEDSYTTAKKLETIAAECFKAIVKLEVMYPEQEIKQNQLLSPA